MLGAAGFLAVESVLPSIIGTTPLSPGQMAAGTLVAAGAGIRAAASRRRVVRKRSEEGVSLHSGLMLANLITLAHFSTSVVMNV